MYKQRRRTHSNRNDECVKVVTIGNFVLIHSFALLRIEINPVLKCNFFTFVYIQVT